MTETKQAFNLVKFLTKYAMVIALVVVFILFSVLTDGRLFLAGAMMFSVLGKYSSSPLAYSLSSMNFSIPIICTTGR